MRNNLGFEGIAISDDMVMKGAKLEGRRARGQEGRLNAAKQLSSQAAKLAHTPSTEELLTKYCHSEADKL